MNFMNIFFFFYLKITPHSLIHSIDQGFFLGS
jgi:hypothetical protein